ncbi:hypothetical protein RHMOL_Rhmol09G0195400 [Rhododendron molle]|uniref:Uncharacterized protein n=1 Tax=Rhododendron molle TaxID=49168 RepID=A0ACC0MGG3_RHOML|nr:hypothetical protein RHMOL_Rhmol09G0195400 [Rhododendron molle]
MSRITIVLFSRSYVCSSWCLEELAVIMDCRSKWGLIVLPIFYDVDPSDVRKQRGYAAAAVSKQRKGGYWYRRWKRALGQAANFCGWDHSANDRERRKNAIQAQVISEMKLLESRGSASITRTTKDDAMRIED